MSQYFLKPSNHKENIKVEIGLSNYAIKTDIKNITHVDTSNFALKTNLANLKTEVDKLDIDKLATVAVDLSKVSNVVKNEVVKKTEYDKLVTKVNNIDTSDFVLKTKYATDKLELENKIVNISGLVKKTDYNTKITELENKILYISNIAKKAGLTIVEDKIPSISNLVKKTDYDTKITEIENKLTDHNHDKCIDTSKFNTLATNVFNTRIAQANLITKSDFDTKLSNLNRKITRNKSDHLLVQNELNKLKTFDSSYYHGKNYFDEDGALNYLVFQSLNKYFKLITNTNFVSSWKSKGLSDESIKTPTTSDNSLNPELNYYGTNTRVKFTGSCLKQSNVSYTDSAIVNIYIVYELGASSSNDNDPTLKNCLFGAVTLTKNTTDIEMYGYSGYGIGLDRRSSFSFPGCGFGQNVLIFGVHMSSSTKIDSRTKNILILGNGPTQGLEQTLCAEKMYSISFTVTKKEILLEFTLQWRK